MASTSTDTPSTNIHYLLTTYPSMDILSTSNPSLSNIVISTLGTSFDEHIVILALLGLSEGEKHISESLGLLAKDYLYKGGGGGLVQVIKQPCMIIDYIKSSGRHEYIL